MSNLPLTCPICRAKNEGSWAYLCPDCWSDFCIWVHNKKRYPNILIALYLPEYMMVFKERVEFT